MFGTEFAQNHFNIKILKYIKNIKILNHLGRHSPRTILILKY